jgi:hypothetical protein
MKEIITMNIENQEKAGRLRVAVDLDETLVFNPSPFTMEIPALRVGAIELLQGLSEKGLEMVLYTSASREYVDHVFDLYPTLRGYFEEVYCRDNTPVKKGNSGIKDPAIVNADIFIDNYIDEDIQTRLGPRAIQVLPGASSESDTWAIEALDRVDKILGR